MRRWVFYQVGTQYLACRNDRQWLYVSKEVVGDDKAWCLLNSYLDPLCTCLPQPSATKCPIHATADAIDYSKYPNHAPEGFHKLTSSSAMVSDEWDEICKDGATKKP